MKLLMITRKVDQNDASPAAPTYNFVKKIGEKLEKLYVITWQESDKGDLPDNIEIISLSGSKWLKMFTIQVKLLKVLSKVDGIFCHQNPEYTVLSALLVKLYGKKIVSWYTHGTVNWKLRLVNLLTNKILTASKESCRLKNRKKIEITGHGIDTDHFKKSGKKESRDKFRIVSIGRISPAKDYKSLIEAIDILVRQKKTNNLEVQIVGGPVLKQDKKYLSEIEQLVQDKELGKYIKFLGPVPYNQILFYYQGCDLFVNLSQTGSIDKAVLEAMACERPVLTSNEAFHDILRDQRLLFDSENPQSLADKIIALMKLSDGEKKEIGQQLRKEVVENHNIDDLVEKIVNQFK